MLEEKGLEVADILETRTLHFLEKDHIKAFETQLEKPFCPKKADDRWVYKELVVELVEAGFLSEEEKALLVMEAVMKREKRFQKLSKISSLEDRMKKASKRQHIPDDVRMFVWQRDKGRCVQCGSNENLEFDHIIPVAKGGSDSERNLQLLCELCNRTKSDSI